MPGHKVKRKLGSDPSDSSGILTVVAVAYAAHRRFDPQTEGLHQPCHGAAGNIVTLTLQLPPDLAHAIDTEVLLDHPLNIWLQGVIPSRSRRQPGRIGAPGGMRMVGRWGDRQHPADRLDPIRPAVIVEEGDHGLVSAVELRPGKIRARLAQDLIGLAKLPVLPLEGLEPGCHIARQARLVPAVALGLLHPLIQRLRHAAYLARYRDDR